MFIRRSAVRTRVPSLHDGSFRPAAERPHAIVAEADCRLRRSIVEVLVEDGFAVAEARDGDELIALLRGAMESRRVEADVLFVNADLPRVSGLDALAAVGSYVDLRSAVVMASRDDASIAARARELGTRGVLDAPLDLDDLRTVAMALLKR
jgi:DNA-binding response OmpR family regulator